MTPRRALTALAVLLLVPAVGAPAAEAAKRKPCQRANTKTIAKNRYARVFERDGGGNGYDTRLFGCLRKRNKAIRLEDAYEFGDVYFYENVTLRRRFVAWSFQRTDDTCVPSPEPCEEETTDQVAVRDLRRKRTRRVTTDYLAYDVLVSRRGALVWTETAGETTVDAHLRNSRGQRVVARGVDDKTKFSIVRDRLVWRQDGRRHAVRVGHY
jgi:hypothetical protein